ncbi:DUF397 domain-containing protein [Streptomyces syringium]|uniref:DUF397 domain-containing protein n=1 Tax=Streptomyces syringium TaxID=76729 RepID=UPI003D902534
MTANAYLALDMADETSWFKSSYSNDNGGGGCISIAVLTDQVGVRDSKQTNGPAFLVPTTAWSAFVDMVR